MLTDAEIRHIAAMRLDAIDLPFLDRVASGKVREIFRVDDFLILVVTDRLSAFDRILGLVPYKGQVLNQLSAFWFDAVSDITPHHLLESPDPNVSVVRLLRPLPVEVVVRGYITGVTSTALWHRYAQGERKIYGIDFPDGLHKNELLPEPIITPTTKARDGGHDERITEKEIVERGFVSENLWRQVHETAIALFQRGQSIAHDAGLILVDTKYEFGTDQNGALYLIDEIHTPDSSRFWLSGSYAERIANGQEPENFDKEFVRLHYAAQGYRGEGEPFPLPVDLAVETSARYQAIYEMLTGRGFVPGELPADARIARNLQAWLQRVRYG